MEHPALEQSRQLLLVLGGDWNASKGQLWRFERANAGAEWTLAGKADVTLGRTGLAWGKGLLEKPLSNGPTKREGDGKAPAGIFALGPAFGYGTAEENQVLHYPYVRATANLVGVDDPKSVHYNTLVRRSAVKTPDWDSAEVMLRKDDLYRLGLVVEHNARPGKQPEAFGSCIFMHIWEGAGVATAGCTAMSAPQMAAILKWLDGSKRPRLVQLTTADYESVREHWGLPEVAKPDGGIGVPWIVPLLLGGFAVAILIRRAWQRSVQPATWQPA